MESFALQIWLTDPPRRSLIHSMWQTYDALCYSALVAARSGKGLLSRDTPDYSGGCLSGCKGSANAL